MSKKYLTLNELLIGIKKFKASDLHLRANKEPRIRLNKELLVINLPKYKPDELKSILYSVLNDKQRIELEENLELDFSFEIPNVGRYRANYFFENGNIGAVFRTIPSIPPSLDDIKAPEVFKKIIKKDKGLILVTGPTGSGKSTTLAAMINEINISSKKHILTIEDPIEFQHESKKSLITQREVGRDTISFKKALRAALREDPDVILVGELRDKETIEIALTAAETGHLVLGTLHTNSAAQTINRIVNVFPAEEQSQIRTQLSLTLNAIISQALVKKKDKTGVLAVHEIMINTPAISNLIRDGKIEQIYSQMQMGQKETKMITLNQSLKNLLQKNLITLEEALSVTYKPEEFKQ